MFSLKRLLPPIIFLLLAAFALRVFRLDAQGLGWEEGIGLHRATSSLGEIVRDRLSNVHLPLCFVIVEA